MSAHDRLGHVLRVDLIVPPRTSHATIPIQLRMPTWIPGSYLIREYARHVVRMQARCGETALAISKPKKDTWEIEICAAGMSQSIAVSFYIYAFDASVRGAFLSSDRWYFNGAAVLPQWLGYEGAIELDIIADDATGDVATTLPAFATDARGFGRYRVADYDALFDYPVEIGIHDRVSFDVVGVPHEIVVTGAVRTDLQRIARDAQKICETHVRMFHAEGPPPFKQYAFLLNILPDGYGGLEHRDSTSLICGVNDLPVAGDPTISEGYLQLLGLISHEYFHAWNVKRIKPSSFIPYDLTCESASEQLWVYEGFTSYYDDLALVRAGVISADDYLRLLGRNATSLARNPGRLTQSIAQSSAESWIKYYRQDENAPNALVSYYLKGGLVALLLDLTLRSTTHFCLDDIMRGLWQDYACDPLAYRGTADDAIATRLRQLTGTDWQPWLARYVFGTDPLPLEAALLTFGIRLRWRTATNATDRGGRADASAISFGTHSLALGFTMQDGTDRIKFVYAQSAAAAAGLSSGDQLVAIDERRATAGNIAEILARVRVGDVISMHVFRNQRLCALSITIPPTPTNTAWCEWQPEPEPHALARRKAWLERG